MTPNERAVGPGVIRTLTGAFDYLDPDPGAINLDDIVRGLHILRWSGQTRGARTVLEHSLHVHDVAMTLTDDPRTLLTALMHDAHEAFVGDVPRPLKQAMRRMMLLGTSPYDEIEQAAMEAVANRFGLIFPHPEIVREADNLVLGWEADHFYGEGTAQTWGLPITTVRMTRGGYWPDTFRYLVNYHTETLTND